MKIIYIIIFEKGLRARRVWSRVCIDVYPVRGDDGSRPTATDVSRQRARHTGTDRPADRSAVGSSLPSHQALGLAARRQRRRRHGPRSERSVDKRPRPARRRGRARRYSTARATVERNGTATRRERSPVRRPSFVRLLQSTTDVLASSSLISLPPLGLTQFLFRYDFVNHVFRHYLRYNYTCRTYSPHHKNIFFT